MDTDTGAPGSGDLQELLDQVVREPVLTTVDGLLAAAEVALRTRVADAYRQGVADGRRYPGGARPGDRVIQDGLIGSLAVCHECGGDGLLHQPDSVLPVKPEVVVTPTTVALRYLNDWHSLGRAAWGLR